MARKRLPGIVKNLIHKAREAALLAVETYNRPTASFRSGAYIVLMHIAWTSLFLAIFHQRKMKPYFRKSKSIRFQREDGERRAWDLRKCLSEYWTNENNPVRENLRFFIGLRNKIEHREMPQLDLEIFGECQAMLFNFEDMLCKEFGDHFTLNQSLAISLQFSKLRDPQKAEAVCELLRPRDQDVAVWIESFRSALSAEIFADMAYSYKVFLLPQLRAQRSKDALAVEWRHYDPSNPEDMEKYAKVFALIKEKHVEVVHAGKLKPQGVVARVQAALGPDKKFKVSAHTLCWKYFGVRPPTGSERPAECKVEYCQYDEVHKDYVYTEKWVEKLGRELADDATYAALLLLR